MPIYVYLHPQTGEIFEVLRSFSQASDPYVAADGVECPKIITMPQIKVGDSKPDRYERKENEQMKRSKDPERARRLRKKEFGSDGISITKSPFYKKEKKIKAKGDSSVDKKQFIQHAARNPNAV